MTARILIVDDMLPSVKMLAAKLAGAGYDVLTATNGPAALDIVVSDDPDLILLDVMMPGMDGFEVCQRVKADPVTRTIPVVMVTALSDAADRLRGLDVGADDFLTKPVNDHTLFARVRSLIRVKRTLDQWRLREKTTRDMGFPLELTGLDDNLAGGATVGVMEPSRIERDNLKAALEAAGHQVVFCQPEENAVKSVAAISDQLELVLIGLGDNAELAVEIGRRLRERDETRTLPLLLIGEEFDSEQMIAALDSGVTDYLVRPVDVGELQARVRTHVNRMRFQARLRETFLQSLSHALTDSLTGVHNARYLLAHMDTLAEHTVAHRKPLALFVVNVDHFKRINDTHGHATGDGVLCAVSRRIQSNIRSFDVVAHLDGGEFAVVMPDTEIELAVAIADRLRKRVEEMPLEGIAGVGQVAVTVSVGVDDYRGPSDNPEALLQRAQDALAAAKRAGRNRVMPAPRDGGPKLVDGDFI